MLPRREENREATIRRVGVGRPIDKFLYPLPAVSAALAVKSVDVVHAVMVNAAALSAHLYLHLRAKPSLLTLQSGDSEDYVRRYMGPFFPLYPRLHRPFRRVHAISSFLKDRAVGYGADPSTVTVIPNGVDIEAFSPSRWPEASLAELRRRLDLGNRRIIVSVSRLALKNALDDLIRAMPSILTSHPDAALLLVGDGEDRQRLEELAWNLDVGKHLRFAGAVEHKEIARYLLISDVFVRPSVSEGLGTAFLEAMACSRPVVGSSVGGISDFLSSGETGLFCQPGRPETIATAVSELLSRADLARRIGANGRRLVEKNYNWDRVAERLGVLYDKLMSS